MFNTFFTKVMWMEMNALADKFRTKGLNSVENTRLELLEMLEMSAKRGENQPKPRSIFDLPIAETMWNADAAEIER